MQRDEPFRRLLAELPTESAHAIVRLAAELAVADGYYKTVDAFVKTKVSEHNDHIGVASDFLADIGEFSYASKLTLETLKRLFEPVRSNPALTADLLAYRAVAETEAQSLVEELEGLVDEHGRPWPFVRKEIRRFVADDAPDESVFRHLHEVSYKFAEFDTVLDLLDLRGAHGLVASACADLARPCRTSETLIRLADATDVTIAEAAKHPESIHQLTGRQFELFLRRIFEKFGFDVQLTSASQDGGIDLLCMSSEFGIPLVLAVEAKRYSPHKAISVELVRSFVGANEQWHANKLVYVTTSRFTRSAVDYANRMCTRNLLTLVDLPQVLQWATFHAAR